MLSLFLLVMCGSNGAIAQQIDPACADVQNAANAAGARESRRVTDAQASIASDIQRSQQCGQQIIDSINRSIPTFGGALVDSVAASISKNLASKACQLIERTQSQIGTQIAKVQLPSPPGIIQQPAAKEAPSTSPAAATSVWSRLSNLF
ncbi:MAG: hypothetical protein V4731_03960 [Pseudomonadota bacterium]